MARRKLRVAADRRKRTLVVADEVWTRLGVEATRRGVDRSRAAEQLLAEALRHIVIQIRGRDSGQTEAAA